MKTIKVVSATIDVFTLYKRANTQAQRALVGYMAKMGLMTDPIFCGAFNVLRNIEWCVDGDEIYSLYPIEHSSIVTKIIDIAQTALNGGFNQFAFSAREIDSIMKCIGNA